MTTILLTTVCRPFGGAGEGDSVAAELFHAQVTRAQGIFSLRQVIRCWGLDYIAHNLQAPCTVLHYPSERELVRELKAHKYHYVGINFVVPTFHKLRRVSELVRRHSPGTRIILGGYGTVLPDELLLPHGDFICREEGIVFMRRLLGEETDAPLLHPYCPIPAPSVYSYPLRTRVAHITGGLGCPNGCDFCSTSHFFKRTYVPFVKTGRELYQLLLENEQQACSKGDEMTGFIVIDEDFFLQEQRAREFLDCVRNGGRSFPLMGFGSVKGLSRFSADEIAEMGFETIWIAFESEEAGYDKLRGKDLDELYASLRSRGIAVLASMIIGFPFQDRAQVEKEFARLMSLAPAMCQFLIYFAFPGTPLHRKVVAEGGFLPEYAKNPDYRRWDGFALHLKHPAFTANELEQLQKDLFRRDFEILGPSLVRLFRVWFEGHRNLKDSANPALRRRAERMGAYLEGSFHGLYPAVLFGPNRERRREAAELLKEIARTFGGFSLKRKILCAATVLLACWTWLAVRLLFLGQPVLLREEHRMWLADRTVDARQPTAVPSEFQSTPS
jgi:hypothetical protein